MPSESSVCAILEIRNGSEVSIFHLSQPVTLIGRSRGDILIEDSEVSSTHCQIQKLADGFQVFDLNSTNGTYLNGRRIIKSKLEAGDVLRVGKMELCFSLTNEVERKKTPSAFEQFNAPFMLEDEGAREVLALIRRSRETCLETMGLILDVTYPDQSSEKIEVQGRNTIIGRITEFGRFNSDEEMSRKHLALTIDTSGDVLAADAGSTNGTFVNEQRVFTPKVVLPSDTIRVGHTKIRVSPRF